MVNTECCSSKSGKRQRKMSALIIYIQQETGDSFQCNKTRREIKSTQFEKKGKTVLIPGWFHLCGKLKCSAYVFTCVYVKNLIDSVYVFTYAY